MRLEAKIKLSFPFVSLLSCFIVLFHAFIFILSPCSLTSFIFYRVVSFSFCFPLLVFYPIFFFSYPVLLLLYSSNVIFFSSLQLSLHLISQSLTSLTVSPLRASLFLCLVAFPCLLSHQVHLPHSLFFPPYLLYRRSLSSFTQITFSLLPWDTITATNANRKTRKSTKRAYLKRVTPLRPCCRCVYLSGPYLYTWELRIGYLEGRLKETWLREEQRKRGRRC